MLPAAPSRAPRKPQLPQELSTRSLRDGRNLQGAPPVTLALRLTGPFLTLVPPTFPQLKGLYTRHLPVAEGRGRAGLGPTVGLLKPAETSCSQSREDEPRLTLNRALSSSTWYSITLIRIVSKSWVGSICIDT